MFFSFVCLFGRNFFRFTLLAKIELHHTLNPKLNLKKKKKKKMKTK